VDVVPQGYDEGGAGWEETAESGAALKLCPGVVGAACLHKPGQSVFAPSRIPQPGA
jgi:hypothetical protein